MYIADVPIEQNKTQNNRFKIQLSHTFRELLINYNSAKTFIWFIKRKAHFRKLILLY